MTVEERKRLIKSSQHKGWKVSELKERRSQNGKRRKGS